MLDHTVFITGTCGIEAHLEVAVIHVDVVEAEFAIGKDRESSFFPAVVAEMHVPYLHRVVHGGEKCLLGVDAAVITEVF